MDPIWLRFQDRNLERQYDAFMFRGLFSKTDEAFLWYMCVFLTTVVLEPAPRSEYKLFYFATIVGIVFAAFWLRKKGPETLITKRSGFVMGVRLFHQIMMAGARPFMCHAYALPSSYISATIRVITVNDVCCFFINSVVFRLKFEHHIMFNTPIMVVMLFARARTFCNCAMESPGAATVLSLEKHLHFVTRPLSTFLHSFITLSPWESKPYLPCYQIVVFSQMFLGVFMTAYVVWVLERRSRAHFVRYMGENQADIELPLIRPAKNGWVTHPFFISALMALTWDSFDWLPAFVDKWGLVPVKG